MKKVKSLRVLQLIFLVTLIPVQLSGQETDWFEFELENIRVDFPIEEVSQLDTIYEGTRINQLYTTIGGSTLIIQEIRTESNLSDENLSSLPHDYNSLIEYYDGVVDGAKNSSNAQRLEKKEIKLGELIGYNAKYYNEGDILFNESNYFLVDNNLVNISYYTLEPGEQKLKNQFFNSLNLDNFESLEQYNGKPPAYRRGYIFGKIAFYIIMAILLFFGIRAIIYKKK